MGCNCKKTAENASKYTDDETFEVVKGIKKVTMVLGKIIIAILLFLILIVTCPFIIVYCMICLIVGKPMKLGLFIRKNKQTDGTRK